MAGRRLSQEEAKRKRGCWLSSNTMPPAASVLDFPVRSPCLFSSLLDSQSKNVCGHRETRRTGLARQSFELPHNHLCLRSRVLPPKFYFSCHSTYSRNKSSTYSNSHQTS